MITVLGTPINATVLQIIKDLQAETGYPKRIANILDTDIMVTCPFHKGGNERTASMGISTVDKKRYDYDIPAGQVHCYTCGYKANLIKFVGDLLNIDKAKAYMWLIKKYAYSVDERVIDINLDREKEIKSHKKGVFDTILIDKYHNQLLNNQRALRYLAGRKLHNVIIPFKLGYDIETDSIVIPLTNLTGEYIGVKQRSIEGKKFYNTKDIEKTLFAGDKVRHLDDTIWIVESEIDALTLWEWGRPAIAVMGCDISKAQIDLFKKLRSRKFILGLDNDEAGKKGSRKLKNTLIPLGFKFFNVKWHTDKKDINELEKHELNLLELY